MSKCYFLSTTAREKANMQVQKVLICPMEKQHDQTETNDRVCMYVWDCHVSLIVVFSIALLINVTVVKATGESSTNNMTLKE